MCVIIYMPKGKKINELELEAAWDYNPDGAGLVYLKDGKIHVKKGYLKFNEFYNDCKDIIFNTSLERIIHFRFTSRGETNASQTHPYPLSTSVRELSKLEYTTTKPVAMMNGTLKIKVEKGLNDTMTWIKNDLSSYADKVPKLMNKLNKNKCRWAIITKDKIHITKDFMELDGIYYSNFNHLDFMESYYNEPYGFDITCDYCEAMGFECVECGGDYKNLNTWDEVMMSLFSQ